MNKTKSTLIIGLLIIFGLSSVSAKSTQLAENACERLIRLDLPETEVTLAKDIAAGKFVSPDGQTFEVPAFCRVQGVAKTNNESDIKFEVWLPSTNWNGRYFQYDAGGVIDYIDYSGFAWRLNKGNVITQVDTIGTWADGKEKTNALTLLSDSAKVFDTTRGHRVAAKRAKAIATEYYQKAPQYSYFIGCSGGGYSALVEAQQNPDAWDGILAGAPANYILPILLGTYSWAGKQWENEAGRIPPEKLPLIQKTALSFCTADAHVVDGIATDPRFCRYDPLVLLCQDQDASDCLTTAQVETLRNIYQGPRLSNGEQIYPGYPPTMEAEISLPWDTGWISMVTGGKAVKGQQPSSYKAFKDVYRNLIKQGAPWSPETFDLDRDYPRAMIKRLSGQYLASIMNADNQIGRAHV